ncbi:hypothetical protein F0562_018691 [Nyssa sinensis]|uniref:DNA endonuclease activator Ctp1 C-terminal domain-containing protein n=1 Tax=Nyssa sinensis TaxID=561372 RepID=A0A5J4ZDY9_9ASTE|nr:hypothetical protein F0562_018691 [Nyssa sinensis]
MEGDLKKSPQLGYSVDSGDAKYVSGLSTILVATIQEAKDRISQIEYIFCSQLFPNFQSISKSLQKIYSEASKAAEDAWKEREKDLLIQIEKLQLEKQQVLEENNSLKLETAKFVNIESPPPNSVCELQQELKQKIKEVAEGRELQQNYNLLLKKQRSLQLEAEELRWQLMKKSKEVDGGMELQNKLLELVQSKASLIVHRDKQLKEHEEKITELLAKVRILEGKIDELQGMLGEKIEEVDKGKELKESLLNEIELQASKMVHNEQLLNDVEKEKKILAAKLERLEESVDGLQKELRKRIEEVEEGRKLHEQLLQQIDLNGLEMSKTGQLLEELDKEKKRLLAKLKCLEEKVDKLQMELREKSKESSEGMELHGKLFQQIEAKDYELQSEKKKRKDVIAAYKNLKSQYNFLCTKFGLTTENMLPKNRIEDENDSLRHNQNSLTSPDIEIRVPNDSVVACELTKLKNNQEDTEDHKGVIVQKPSSDSPASSSSPIAPKYPTKGRSGPLSGSKRPGSNWRDTRSHQNRSGPDPHDDFLDTPLENIRENLRKPVKEEVHDLWGPVPKDMNFDNSDDETQDMNVDPGAQKQQMPAPRPGTRGFKYVEPVRKKAERENLKGIECKQCKKFYDAVLPNGGGGNEADGNKQNLRCEHHNGVSRHRYRYAPPLTPEGFWNIGFESEM